MEDVLPALNPKQIEDGIKASDRLIGSLPCLSDVRAMRESLEKAYDDLTHQYMNALEQLVRLEAIAPRDKPFKRSKQTQTPGGGLKDKVIEFLKVNGPCKFGFIANNIEGARSSINFVLQQHRGTLFDSPKHGVWALYGQQLNGSHVNV